MRKHPIISTILIAFFSFQAFGQKEFSESMLKEDLLFYKTKLEQNHPNLYLYTSKEKINIFFDSLYNSINHPLNETDFFQRITTTSDIIKDGHTLILPSNNFIEYHNTQNKFLPFQIGLTDQKLYIKMNCTITKQLEDGSIIDSINGVSADNIIQSLLKRQVRDGNNLSYANWILDTYFREYYSYTFGHPDTFRLSYIKDNYSYTIRTPALMKDSIYHYRKKRYPLFNSENAIGKGIYLSYDTSKQLAILTIKDFHTDVLRSEYKQNFTKEIQNIFEELLAKKTSNLVIDLRNNQGGDVENGVYLLKYLVAKPFKVVNEYQKVKNGSLSKGKGPSMGFHSPNAKQFKGQIYVLLNGGSFSNSVIFSSCLRENTTAIFVGTESGGNPNVLAGYAKDFELPNTKIKVQVPTKRFIMTSLLNNNGSGLLPTYRVEPNIIDIINNIDTELEYTIKLMNEKNNGR